MNQRGETSMVVAAVVAAGVITAGALTTLESGTIRLGAISAALLAIGGLLYKLHRKTIKPLHQVLAGRPPQGHDPGQPALADFIRESLEYREQDKAWKQAISERLDALQPNGAQP